MIIFKVLWWVFSVAFITLVALCAFVTDVFEFGPRLAWKSNLQTYRSVLKKTLATYPWENK